MGYKSVWFGLCCILIAYYIFTPLPEAIEEPWKVMVVDAGIKLTSMTAILFENIGLMKYEELFLMLITLDYTEAISDENVTVTDTAFGGISVRLYLPKRKSEGQRPAVIFVHGGAFVLGSCKQTAYDSLNRWTANKLGAVVVGVDYRTPPRYQFPVSLEDVVSVVKFFLKDNIVIKYGVDPTRVCITGDSSGGTLAAEATQLRLTSETHSGKFGDGIERIHSRVGRVESLGPDISKLQNDPDFKIKIKAQALIYPCLQIFDTLTPSHQDNEQGPILSRDLAIRLAHLYLANDTALRQAMNINQHMPQESRHLFQYVNWSILPDKFKKNHVYTEPIFRRLNRFYPELMDSRVSPLVANDSELRNLPLTYIATCQYDILRDDGLLYVTRLQNLGVPVTHDHLEDGFHGALSLMASPVYLRLGMKIKDKYISWLEKNL